MFVILFVCIMVVKAAAWQFTLRWLKEFPPCCLASSYRQRTLLLVHWRRPSRPIQLTSPALLDAASLHCSQQLMLALMDTSLLLHCRIEAHLVVWPPSTSALLFYMQLLHHLLWCLSIVRTLENIYVRKFSGFLGSPHLPPHFCTAKFSALFTMTKLTAASLL